MRVRALLVAALAVLFLISACAPKASIEARWPRADSERSVPQPAAEIVWPLTGKPALDASAAASPAVALPVDDGAPGASLPGLDSADLVYEIAVGKPRVLALFQSALPASAGPLRAATSVSDPSLAHAYGASLAKGSGDGSFADVSQLAARPASGAVAPPQLPFASQPPSATAGDRVRALEVPVGSAKVEWRWDASRGAWARFVGGQQTYASPTSPLYAKNLVVLWVAEQSDWPPKTMTGAGRASVFVEGRKLVASWEASGAAPSVIDAQGAPLPLQPGNTWVEVLGNAADVVFR